MRIEALASMARDAYETLVRRIAKRKFEPPMPPWDELPTEFRLAWLETAATVARRVIA